MSHTGGELPQRGEFFGLLETLSHLLHPEGIFLLIEVDGEH